MSHFEFITLATCQLKAMLHLAFRIGLRVQSSKEKIGI